MLLLLPRTIVECPLTFNSALFNKYITFISWHDSKTIIIIIELPIHIALIRWFQSANPPEFKPLPASSHTEIIMSVGTTAGQSTWLPDPGWVMENSYNHNTHWQGKERKKNLCCDRIRTRDVVVWTTVLNQCTDASSSLSIIFAIKPIISRFLV